MKRKLIVGALLLAGGYYGFDYIAAARIGYLSLQCASPSDLENISAESKLTTGQQLKISSRIFSCVQEKQNPFERLIIRVPEKWINPPEVYE